MQNLTPRRFCSWIPLVSYPNLGRIRDATQAAAGTLDVQKDLLDPYPFLIKIRELTRFPKAKVSTRQAIERTLADGTVQEDELPSATMDWTTKTLTVSDGRSPL